MTWRPEGWKNLEVVKYSPSFQGNTDLAYSQGVEAGADAMHRADVECIEKQAYLEPNGDIRISRNDWESFSRRKWKINEVFFWTRHGKYGFLSNFYCSPIAVGSQVYPTVEHFYQSSKTLLPEESEMVRHLKTPKEAKFAGAHVTLREDWEDMKEEVMLTGLRAKFTQHQDLRERLLATLDSLLHEDSPWDKYWGYVGGKGLDRLGKLLAQVRDELIGEVKR